jgi:hypothetical protein
MLAVLPASALFVSAERPVNGGLPMIVFDALSILCWLRVSLLDGAAAAAEALAADGAAGAFAFVAIRCSGFGDAADEGDGDGAVLCRAAVAFLTAR